MFPSGLEAGLSSIHGEVIGSPPRCCLERDENRYRRAPSLPVRDAVDLNGAPVLFQDAAADPKSQSAAVFLLVLANGLNSLACISSEMPVPSSTT